MTIWAHPKLQGRYYLGESVEELEKYRPSTVYREYELEVQRGKPLVEDFAWESQYQIGPETLLIPARGARFNARVRDYRREMWGDSAAQVLRGILGYRNQDITVRERRRYTDLLRGKRRRRVTENCSHTE